MSSPTAETIIYRVEVEHGSLLNLGHEPECRRPYRVYLTNYELGMRPLTLGIYRSRWMAERRFHRYARRHQVPGSDNPLTAEEVVATIGAERATDLASTVQTSIRMYGHDEARRRLREIAEMFAQAEKWQR